MNNKRRKRLREAGVLVGNALSIVEQVKDEEQDSLDNMPEGLQESERCAMMEESIDDLDSALTSMNEAADYIDRAIGR